MSFWFAILASFTVAMLPNPTPIGVSDKTQHFFLFVALTLLAAVAHPAARLLWLTALLAIFGALIELCQALVAIGRSGELLDWIADVGGIAASAATIGVIREILLGRPESPASELSGPMDGRQQTPASEARTII